MKKSKWTLIVAVLAFSPSVFAGFYCPEHSKLIAPSAINEFWSYCQDDESGITFHYHYPVGYRRYYSTINQSASNENIISSAALGFLNSVPAWAQPHIIHALENECNETSGHRAAKFMSASERANQLEIPVEKAIAVNDILLKFDGERCSSLISPAVLVRPAQHDRAGVLRDI
jgi:hypothetical protein